MEKKPINYKTISLPEDLVSSISTFIEINSGLGYSSIAGFLKDACRELFSKYNFIPSQEE